MRLTESSTALINSQVHRLMRKIHSRIDRHTQRAAPRAPQRQHISRTHRFSARHQYTSFWHLHPGKKVANFHSDAKLYPFSLQKHLRTNYHFGSSSGGAVITRVIYKHNRMAELLLVLSASSHPTAQFTSAYNAVYGPARQVYEAISQYTVTRLLPP